MLPATLKGFTLFADGYGLVGKLDEGQLPELNLKMEEHRDGGMDGVIELDLGQEKMESTYILDEYVPEALTTWGLTGGVTKSFTLRGSAEDEDGNTVPIVAEMRGITKQSKPSNWKAGSTKDAKLTLVQAVRYYRLTVGGREIYEIDVENVIRRVDGVDQLAARRQALGLA